MLAFLFAMEIIFKSKGYLKHKDRMAKNIIAIIFCCHISVMVSAQAITNEYIHQKQLINFEPFKVFSGPDTISLSEYKTISRHVYEKQVSCKSGHLTLRWEKDNDKAYLQTATGEKKAIISFEHETYFDVMVDSNQYVWESKEVTSWKYTLNGKAVMSCKISKPNGKHILKITILDSNAPDIEMLKIVSAHLAVVQFQRQTQARINALMIPLALLRTALTIFLVDRFDSN
jgi:hypothetical protein